MPLTHEQCPALRLGHGRERIAETAQTLSLADFTTNSREHVEVDAGHDGSPRRGAPLHAADVLRDRVQPRELVLGRRASRQSSVGLEERGLDGVLGLSTIAESMEAVREDARGVALVERPASVVEIAAAVPVVRRMSAATRTPSCRRLPRCSRELLNRAMTLLGDLTTTRARFGAARLLRGDQFTTRRCSWQLSNTQ